MIFAKRRRPRAVATVLAAISAPVALVPLAALAAPAPAAAALPNPAMIRAELAAARRRQIRLEHSPAVKVLNTYYLRIAAAVVTHNDSGDAKLFTAPTDNGFSAGPNGLPASEGISVVWFN